MMKKLLLLAMVSLVIFACDNASSKEESQEVKKVEKVQPTIGPKVKITTDMGEIIVGLYNETPQHRDNFVKLVQEGFYDDLLFHRVISNFMIQGGDPESKDATPEQMLGNGGPGYQIPAEIIDGLYHKKGALAAARTSDQVNPERKSSGCQFYIVQGRVADSASLSNMVKQKNYNLRTDIFREIMADSNNIEIKTKLDDFRKANDREGYNNYIKETIEPIIDKKVAPRSFEYSQEQIDTYATIGGTPHLDMQYTVFGEVIEGLDIIDKIAQVEKNRADRPKTDIHMKMELIK